MKNLYLALFASLVISGCSKLKLHVEYDNKYDFSTLSKYAVVYSKKDDEKDAVQAQISMLLNRYFKSMGYRNVYMSESDFYAVVDYDTQNKRRPEQRILLKIFDTKENKIIWEASAIDREFESFSAEQKSAYIKDILEKLFRGETSK